MQSCFFVCADGGRRAPLSRRVPIGCVLGGELMQKGQGAQGVSPGTREGLAKNFSGGGLRRP